MENQLFQGEDVVVTYETMTNPLNIHNVNILVQKMIEKDEINDRGKSDVHMWMTWMGTITIDKKWHDIILFKKSAILPLLLCVV